MRGMLNGVYRGADPVSLPREVEIEKWTTALLKKPGYARVKVKRKHSREGEAWDDRLVITGRGGWDWSLGCCNAIPRDPPPSMKPHRVECKQRHTRGHTEWTVEFLSNRVAGAQRARWLNRYKEKERG